MNPNEQYLAQIRTSEPFSSDLRRFFRWLLLPKKSYERRVLAAVKNLRERQIERRRRKGLAPDA